MRPATARSPEVESLEARRLLSAGNGLSAAYYNGLSPAGTAAHTEVDSNLNFDWGSKQPAGVKSSQFSAVWTGQIEPLYSENYTFTLHSDSARMWINGKQIINSWLGHAQPADDASAPVALQAGTRYDIRIEYFHRTSSTDAAAQLQWQSPSQPLAIVPPTQLFALSPFPASPATTEQRIQAEDFDTGAAGVAYYDTTPGNAGGVYRSTDVDIAPTSDTGGGFQVGYVAPGEWLDYSLKVPAAGLYYLDVRLAAKGAGGKFHAEIDGVNVTGAVSIPNTGSWNTFQTVTVGGISLTPGWHVLRLVSDTAGKSGAVANYNWLELRQEFLQPGTGFLAPTLQPANMGSASSFGYTDKAIARWDVVPYQTFTGNFNVGVVAFHNSGIDHVSFSVNGGAWINVSQMTPNPQTGVTEYWATLRAGDFNDGPLEIRSIAYPKVGVPRVLQGTADTGNGEVSMFLNADAHGTLPTRAVYVSTTGSDTTGDGSAANPFATILHAAWALKDMTGNGLADNGTIYLANGDYTYGGPTNYALPMSNAWLTITAAPGASKDQVRLITPGSTDGMRAEFIHLSNLTIAAATAQAQTILTSNGPLVDYMWVDGCNLIGPGRTVDGTWANGFSGLYVTDSSVSSCRDGLAANLVRNETVSNIGSDAFSGSAMVINSIASNIDSSGTTFHPDVVQYVGSPGQVIENRIVYGLTATQQINSEGLFADGSPILKDFAFVNCNINNGLAGAYVFQFCGVTDNMYLTGCTLIGSLGGHWAIEKAFTATDVVIESTQLTISPSLVPGVVYR